jgi:DNA-binding MarR family transcriptional regulator
MSDDKIPAVPAEAQTEDLAALVAGLSRFMSGLSKLPQFEQAKLGFAEWSVLSILSKGKPFSSAQLMRTLGVSKQRVSQIIDSLKTENLIELSPVAGDARKKLISITSAGTDRMNKLNTSLQPLVSSALTKRPNSLARASRIVNRSLMRIVAPARKPADR